MDVGLFVVGKHLGDRLRAMTVDEQFSEFAFVVCFLYLLAWAGFDFEGGLDKAVDGVAAEPRQRRDVVDAEPIFDTLGARP